MTNSEERRPYARGLTRGLLRWTPILNQSVQIVAVLVGGWWTYRHFIATEAPALKQNFATEQQLSWAKSPMPSACYALLIVNLQNVSRSSIRVEKVIRRAWLIPLPEYTGALTYLDPETLAKKTPADSASYTAGAFVQTYPPQAKVRYDLAWTLRRASGLALFRVDLYAHATDTEPIEWIYDWDEICGDSEPATG